MYGRLHKGTIKNRRIMGYKWTYCILYVFFLSCYTNLCFTSGILPPTGLYTSNDTSELDNSNSSLELHHVNQQQNGTTQTSHLIHNGSTTEDALPQRSNISDLGLKDNDANASPNSNESGKPSVDLLDENEYPSTLSNRTSAGNRTTVKYQGYFFCHFFQSDDVQKDPTVKTYFGGHKLLAMFLGMAGVLVCLLILIYCIYIRQHKEEMFSHHRLFGEGFEDPVLHLDTPVDHLDFFSFRDTELTPAPTPQLKCYKTETYETKGDDKVEAPRGTSSNEHLHHIIQMGSIKQS
ncbi:Golgi-associated olfactory signaling regulator [Hyla sarda]|uniref:Golgi-associated olfactory signaling regulator n=1 Tax=Hyla sarda TaxID=327740 RepID=UPI0024C26C68|nr:Golgi-associated olfactory signaling regulator [Hyla sarda]